METSKTETAVIQYFYFNGLVMPADVTAFSTLAGRIQSVQAYKTCSMTIWF